MRNLLFGMLFALAFIGQAIACSAQNHCGKKCETNCGKGQVGTCWNGTGCNEPVCICSVGKSSLMDRLNVVRASFPIWTLMKSSASHQ